MEARGGWMWSGPPRDRPGGGRCQHQRSRAWPTTALLTSQAVTRAGNEARVDAQETQPQLPGGGPYEPPAQPLTKPSAKLWSRLARLLAGASSG